MGFSPLMYLGSVILPYLGYSPMLSNTGFFFILRLALPCLLNGRAGPNHRVYQGHTCYKTGFQLIQLFDLLSTYRIRLACERKERSRLACFVPPRPWGSW